MDNTFAVWTQCRNFCGVSCVGIGRNFGHISDFVPQVPCEAGIVLGCLIGGSWKNVRFLLLFYIYVMGFDLRWFVSYNVIIQSNLT